MEALSLSIEEANYMEIIMTITEGINTIDEMFLIISGKSSE